MYTVYKFWLKERNISKVWKIGSRWDSKGKKDSSIYNIFIKNKIVFCGKHGKDLQKKVKVGDYIAIADGIMVKSIGKVTSNPDVLSKIISEENFKITEDEKQVFDYSKNANYARGCKVDIVEISPKFQFTYKIGIFFAVNMRRNKIIDLYENKGCLYYESEVSLYTTDEEKKLHNELKVLFNEWRTSLKSKLQEKKYDVDKEFIEDGFYPGYLSQPTKILFIGREARHSAKTNDYIYSLYNCFNKKTIGNISINRYRFHSTMLKLTYAIINNKTQNDWKSLPKANTLAQSIGKEGGISFAFMNISKFSNNTKHWQKLTNQINLFVKNSKDEIRDEINLLKPDIIFTLNLKENLSAIGDKIKNEDMSCKDCRVYNIKLNEKKENGKTAIWLDTYHFSATLKSPEKDIYKPCMERILKLRTIKD